MPDNAQLARGIFEEVFSKGKTDFIDQNYDANFRGHDTLDGEYGKDRLKKNVQIYRTAFPDLTMKVDEIISSSSGDKVLVRWTAQGTHRGPFMGKAPTGKATITQGLSVITCRGGKITEEWTQWDALSLLRDLGLAPSIPQPTAQPMP